MSLLLDTHAFAWLFLGDPRLPQRMREFVERYEAEVYVSAVSAYEMAQKHRLGKWPDVAPLMDNFERLALEAHLTVLNMTPLHAIRAGLIPGAHRDPFDRILVAQAMVERLRIVSSDEGLRLLGAEPLWG